MGKHRLASYYRQGCADKDAPICGSKCCEPSYDEYAKDGAAHSGSGDILRPNSTIDHDDDDDIRELIVIGAGPHAHALMLRLLSPEPDFLSDKERHTQAEYKERMRPPREVNQYLKKLTRGPKATLKRRKKTSMIVIDKSNHRNNSPPPPLTLDDVTKSVLIVDKYGSWLHQWTDTFKALRIPHLRSLMSAHACPYDHRSLEYYAEKKGRGDELITLRNLDQRDKTFKGPYQVPSTSIFNEFHELLSRAHGIENAVSKGTVLSIHPMQDPNNMNDAIFEVKISQSSTCKKTIKARRIVCALGPMFKHSPPEWEIALQLELGVKHEAFSRILHAPQICPFINQDKYHCIGKILIVGGGITSAQLVLLAHEAPWCESVTLIQRSAIKSRHFDIHNAWLGPKRGKLLEEFHCLEPHDRAKKLKQARGGGTIPPEIVEQLRAKQECQHLQVEEEVEIFEVQYLDGQFSVTLTDGSNEEYDMIWLATGAENHIDHYSVLSDLRNELPVDVVNGLPVLGSDLSWKAPQKEENNDELDWKQTARKRIWCMGALAALELGPDALNLVGARQGSVRVAKAIRQDFEKQNSSH